MIQQHLPTQVAFPGRTISPLLELGAYEALWALPAMTTFRKVADRFREDPDALPSDLVERGVAAEKASWVVNRHLSRGVRRFGVRVHRAGEYPAKLRDATHPVELLQYQGIWHLSELPSVAVVGTRKPSEEGIARTEDLVRHLVHDNYAILSGLAQGIDTIAHKTAIDESGVTIAVIGTPLSDVYPRANAELQRRIARDFLVASPVPVYRYARQDWRRNRSFFPERNAVMSALSDATVIVEAGDTSGTLTQARAALAQGRKLFILDSCFRNQSLRWPHDFEAKGAVRIHEYAQLSEALQELQREQQPGVE